MRLHIWGFALGILSLGGACTPDSAPNPPENKPQAFVTSDSASIENRRLNPNLIWSMGRISGGSISPDGSQFLCAISRYSVKQNQGNRDLFLLDVATGALDTLTHTSYSENNEVWAPNGQSILFLAKADSTTKIYSLNLSDRTVKEVVGSPEGITGFKISADGSKLVFSKLVKLTETVADKYPDLPEASGRIYDDLMFRHWDEWADEKFSHIFVADLDLQNLKIGDATDIMALEAYDSPTLPFGGTEEFAISPDNKQIAYTAKKKSGKEYALSTNSEIFLYDLGDQSTQNISEGQMGYDRSPSFSPNGQYIAWTSMARDGFEADKNNIFLWNRQTATGGILTQDFDQSAASLKWSADASALYFLSGVQATEQIYKLQLADTSIVQITEGDYDYTDYELAGSQIFANRMSISAPSAFYKITEATRQVEPFFDTNQALLSKVDMGRVEKRWITTTDQKRMLAWVIYPPDFDPNKKYPTLLYCQGGPQSTVSQFWSYRWNFQLMAANGYIIVAPNRRGLPSFGQAWNDQISKNYGGQNIQDYLSAIDELAKEPYVDASRLGAIGASYGGFSVYHLAGVHQKRFKTFVAHAGIFNLQSMYGSTEELFFVDWDLGGPYWNPQAVNSYAASPHLFVNKWDTPIMVIHGELDYRVPLTQGINAFTAARLKNLKSRFLYFPDENHWILKPQNGVLWHREFFRWLHETL